MRRSGAVRLAQGEYLSGPDIFISYSREDRVAAQHFAEAFAQEGFKVWWDAALHSGETFDEVIEAELKAAKAVVVLWSPRSVTSRWVRAEATLADRRNKLAPAIIEPCDRPIIFELTHTADLSDWSGALTDPAWRAFVKDLHRLVDKGRNGARAANAPGASGTAPQAAEPAPARRFADRLGEARRRDSGAEKADLASARFRAEDSKPPSKAPRPAARDEEEQTRFYAGSPAFGPSGDEFHCLEITSGDKLEQRFVVSPLGLRIGRTAPADIVLADARVSRSHCLIELADHRLRVSDLNSTNGTFIDGKRIKGFGWLEVGAVLRVGDVAFVHAVRTKADG